MKSLECNVLDMIETGQQLFLFKFTDSTSDHLYHIRFVACSDPVQEGKAIYKQLPLNEKSDCQQPFQKCDWR